MTDDETTELEESPINRELLETMLKKVIDKLKFNLCLKFPNDSYHVTLVDGLSSDAVILNGDTVTIKIKTSVFVNAMTKRGLGDSFRQLLEQCLRQVPRMQVTLTHQPKANVLLFDEEKRTFKRVTQQEYDELNPTFKVEKDIHYKYESRVSAIHWKSGTIVRATGTTPESAQTKARRKILEVLNNPEIMRQREGSDEWFLLDSHDDMIYDMVVRSKVLSKGEVRNLISQLTKEYL